MWIAPDGRAITNAWADATHVLPRSVIRLIASLDDDSRQALAKATFEAVLTCFTEIDGIASTADQTSEAPFVDQWMPASAVGHLKAKSAQSLVEELQQVDLRWRLDALLTVESYASRN